MDDRIETYRRMREADRAWFDQHPERLCHIRWPTDGDELVEDENAVLVLCPIDGMRQRIGVIVQPWRVPTLTLIYNDPMLLPLVRQRIDALEQSSDAAKQRRARWLHELMTAVIEHGGRLPKQRLDGFLEALKPGDVG